MPSSEGVSIALLFLLSAKHMPCPQLGRWRGKQQSHQRMYVADCATVFQRRQEIGRCDTIPLTTGAVFARLWICFLVGLANVETILAHLLIERGAVDIQLSSGFLAVIVFSLEGVLDDLSLGTFKGLLQGHGLFDHFFEFSHTDAPGGEGL